MITYILMYILMLAECLDIQKSKNKPLVEDHKKHVNLGKRKTRLINDSSSISDLFILFIYTELAVVKRVCLEIESPENLLAGHQVIIVIMFLLKLLYLRGPSPMFLTNPWRTATPFRGAQL